MDYYQKISVPVGWELNIPVKTLPPIKPGKFYNTTSVEGILLRFYRGSYGLGRVYAAIKRYDGLVIRYPLNTVRRL